jgi:PAS domain-containing protein
VVQSLPIDCSEDADALIRRVYDSVLGDDPLRALFHITSELFDCSSGGVRETSERHPNGCFVVAHPGEADAFNRAFADVATTNLWYLRGLPLLLRRGFSHGDEVATLAEVKRTPYYQAFLRLYEMDYTLGLVLRAKAAQSLTLMSVTRPEALGPFTAFDMEIVKWLLPHLRAAYNIHRRLEELAISNRDLVTALSTLTTGVLLLGDKGTVLHANEAANSILAERGALRLVGGRVRASGGGEDRTINNAIALAAGAQGSFQMRYALRGSGSEPELVISLSSVHGGLADLGAPGARAIMLLQPTVPRVRNPEAILRASLQLTPSEAALAVALLSVGSLPEACATLGKRHETGRTQLKSLMAKTGTRSQAAVIRVVSATLAAAGMQPSSDAI